MPTMVSRSNWGRNDWRHEQPTHHAYCCCSAMEKTPLHGPSDRDRTNSSEQAVPNGRESEIRDDSLDEDSVQATERECTAPITPLEEKPEGASHHGDETMEPNLSSSSPMSRSRRLSFKYEALGGSMPLLETRASSNAKTVLSTMKQSQLNSLNRSLSSSQRDDVAIPVDHLLDESNNGEYDSESVVTGVEATHVFAQALVLGAVAGTSPQPNPCEIGQSASHALNDQLPPLPYTDASTESARPKRRLRLQIGGIIVATFLVAAAISLGVTCGDGAPGCSQRRQQADMGIENATQLPNTSVQPVGGPLPLPLSYSALLIVDYINNITLTGRKVELPATPFLNSNPEDLALRWLIYDDKQLNWSRRDDGVSLSLPPINTFRLQQRYALTTMWIQNREKFVNGSLLHECEWEGVTCQAIDRGSPIGSEATVTEINLPSKGWRGMLSADLGLLSNLRRFDLHKNLLTGSFSSSIGRWTKLEYFDVKINSLVGSLPESMGAWTSMDFFDLYFNDFTGTFPSALRNWTNVTVFDITAKDVESGLSGPLPHFIGNWSNLRNFSVAWNSLSSTLPSAIGRLTGLKSFDVGGNRFTGSFPQMQSTVFEVLDVRRNNLSGQIPLPRSNLTNLAKGFFFGNEFTGVVPIGYCEGVNVSEFWADCQSKVSCSCCTRCS